MHVSDLHAAPCPVHPHWMPPVPHLFLFRSALEVRSKHVDQVIDSQLLVSPLIFATSNMACFPLPRSHLYLGSVSCVGFGVSGALLVLFCDPAVLVVGFWRGPTCTCALNNYMHGVLWAGGPSNSPYLPGYGAVCD